MFSFSRFEHTNYTKSPFTYTEPLSCDYKVTVNGTQIPVYTCRISQNPINSHYPGYQRPINQTELVSFVNLVSDEALDFQVEVLKAFDKAEVRPYSKGILCKQNANKVSFTIDSTGQFVLTTGDFHGCLYIFNSAPIPCDNPAQVTHYFGPGIHMPGKITLHDNESVYVHRDALVFGCIYAENAKNIRVFGNGLFDDSGEERFSRRCYEAFTNGNLRLYDCSNARIEGVLFRNSAIWCVSVFHCDDVVFDNIKVFGQWRYNTDGIDIVNSKNVTVKNAFVHSFDDTICIKGIDRYIGTDCANILVDNCVLWCDWGRCCEFGFETACRECKQITFQNCDILRAANVALDIQNGDCAEIHHVLFDNIRVEYNACDYAPQISADPYYRYDREGNIHVPILINIVNTRFREVYHYTEMAYVDLTGVQVATVHDVEYRNIRVYYDEKIPKLSGKFNVPIEISSCLESVKHYNIRVSGITVNGVAINEENSVLNIRNVENFTLESDDFTQTKKNTVDPQKQLNARKRVRMINPAGKGIRVMFVGNSITYHGVKEDIGWYGNYGMAASCAGCDYVHILIQRIQEVAPDAVFCIAQVADWETNYKNPGSLYGCYSEARDFGADVMVARFIENCPYQDFDEEVFSKEYESFLDYLGAKEVIYTTGFWKHPGDHAICRIAEKHGTKAIVLGDLGELDEMKAAGLFEHPGVCQHPGDKGMRTIADRVWQALLNSIQRTHRSL